MKGEYVSGMVDVGGDVEDSSLERPAIARHALTSIRGFGRPYGEKVAVLGSPTSLGDVRSCVIPRVLISEKCASRIRNLSHPQRLSGEHEVYSLCVAAVYSLASICPAHRGISEAGEAQALHLQQARRHPLLNHTADMPR
jgi:hypothetical protein